jgi:branched-chain amino acid aminotransferase
MFCYFVKITVMQNAGAIKITKAERSKRADIDFSNLSFGKYFTDHMLVADYNNGVWGDPEIVPYAPICFDPSMATLHYGQSIFEGVKAYRMADGTAAIFRPIENFKRFNRSAQRMEMAEIPEHIFMEGMKTRLEVESQWIPKEYDHALYIRPFMFATDEQLGVAPSSRYKFMIICSPVGPFYPAPLRLHVEEQFVRAVPGGVGNAKTSGNYAASLHPTAVAKKRGFDQVLWTDAVEHKYVQECGTMNVFFVIGGRLITPSLASGTILEGITRDSVIKVAQDMGKIVEEREISVDELAAAYKDGSFTEAFGAGTAATISKITELQYKDFTMSFDSEAMENANEIKAILTTIRDGVAPDPRGWMLHVAG